jgi:flagellar protein FliL
MTDAAADEDIEEEFDDADEEGSDQPGLGQRLKELFPPGKARVALIAGLALVVVMGGIGGAFMFGAFDGLFGGGDEEAKAYQPVNVVFYELPEMVVNLETGTTKPAFLKIALSLELDDDVDIAVLDRLLPRVVDQFQVFLRELRVDDLSGSAGVYRIKEELLRRVTAAVHPVVVRDVLFNEMLIQ